MSDPTLSLEELLAPIPGDQPAGVPINRDLRDDPDELRREDDPDKPQPMVDGKPAPFKTADWPAVQALCSDVLTKRSKDFRLLAPLTQSLAKQYGFPGAEDGLMILKAFLEQCWERSQPEDELSRAASLVWFFEKPRDGGLDALLRALPLAASGDRKFGQVHHELSTLSEERNQGYTPEEFRKAANATDAAACQANFDCLGRLGPMVGELSALLGKRFGEKAPGVEALRKAIADCREVAVELMGMKGLGRAAEPVAAAAESKPAAARSSGPAESRAEIYNRIREAADALERLEPHSPIPHLLRRAVELRDMKFPQMIKTLQKAGNFLDTITETFEAKD